MTHAQRHAESLLASGVIHEVCQRLGLKEQKVLGQQRHRDLYKARREIAMTLWQDVGMSYVAIGRVLGGRHHTTIMHILGGLGRQRRANVDETRRAA